MLSDELRGLAVRFEAFSSAGSAVTISSGQARNMAAYFRGLADQAKALEGQPVPARQRGDLPEGVVDLARHRRFSRWLCDQTVPPYGSNGPGGAA